MKTTAVTLRIYLDLLGLILYVTIQVSSSDEWEYGLPGRLTSRILITLGLFSQLVPVCFDGAYWFSLMNILVS